jgi:ADP-heptose:LPS heptosyltransferase
VEASEQANTGINSTDCGGGTTPNLEESPVEMVMAQGGKRILSEALQGGAAPEVWIRFPRQLGDVVFTLPFLGTLQRAWNAEAAELGAQLKWIAVGHDIGASLFSEADPSFIAQSLIQTRRNGKPNPWALLRQWRKRRPAAVLNLSQSVRLALAAWLARVPIRGGDVDNHLTFLYHHHFNYRDQSLHLAKRAEFLLRQLTEVHDLRCLRLTPSIIGGNGGMTLLESLGWKGEEYITLAFGTRLDLKRWLPEEESWPELARIFQKQGYTVVWLGGPDEIPLGKRLASLTPGSMDATGRTTIPEACAIQSQAYGTVAVDTGLAHTSAATGRPTVTLFIGTTFEYWATPQGPYSLTLRPQVVDPEVPRPARTSTPYHSDRIQPRRVAELLHLLAREAGEDARRDQA